MVLMNKKKKIQCNWRNWYVFRSTHFTMVKSLNIYALSFVETFKRKTEWVILVGDRGEQLIFNLLLIVIFLVAYSMVKIWKYWQYIKTCLSKIFTFTFCLNKDAFKRLIKREERVFNVGAPQLDEITNKDYLNETELQKYSNISNFLGSFDPITEEFNELKLILRFT